MWMNFEACSATAASTAGCRWPSALTATPDVKSRNRFSSASMTNIPSPRSMTSGYERV
jgi:hypothetical protein